MKNTALIIISKIFRITIFLSILYSCIKEEDLGSNPSTLNRNDVSSDVEIFNINLPADSILLNNGKYFFFQRKGKDILIEGDILLTNEQFELIKNKNSTSNLRINSSPINNLARKWPNGVMYYKITDESLRSRIESAMNHISNNSAVKFIERTTQTDYVNFVTGGGCASYIGKIGGRQIISLASGCTTGNTIHEIGHALGLGHSSGENLMGSINTNLEGLMTGDIKGIQAIYGE